jgi:acetyl esterase
MRASLGERLRRRAGAALVDGFFRGASRLGRLHPHARPERHGVVLERDVEYLPGGQPEHRLDVYRPAQAGNGPLPLVLYVHGGGFRILSKDTHWVMGLAYARRGYLVLNASYRLAPKHPYPAAVEDVAAAYVWAVENAARLGGDPARLIVAGESAGANLVTSLAVMACYERPEPWARRVFRAGVVPRAVVAACGLFQVSEPRRFRRRFPQLAPFVEDRIVEVSEAYLGRTRAESLDLADPLLLFERGERPLRPLPPFFVPCGTRDPLLDDTRRLEAALQKLGVTCEARYYEGEMHAFHALVFREPARRCWGHTYAFLDRWV